MWTRAKKISDEGEASYAKTQLLDPLIVNHIDGNSLDTLNWSFDIGYHFREAIGLRLCPRSKTTTVDGIKKKKSWKVWQQTPILSFHEGDCIHHGSDGTLVQVEEGLQSGFEQENLEHGQIRFTRFTFNTIAKKWEKKDRFSTNQFDFLLMLIFGYEYLNRMNPLILEKTNKETTSTEVTNLPIQTEKISTDETLNLVFDF